MSDKNEYGFDLDNILAEFSAYSEQLAADEAKAQEDVPDRTGKETYIEKPAFEDLSPAADNIFADAVSEQPEFDAAETFETDEIAEPVAVQETEPVQSQREPDISVQERPRAAYPDFEWPETPKQASDKTAQAKPKPARKSPDKPAPAQREDLKEALREESREAEAHVAPAAVRVLLSIAALALMALALVWTGINVHPGTERCAAQSGTSARTDLVSKLDVYLNNAASDAMGDLAYIKKQYTLDYYSTVAPKPDASKYGTVSISEADKVMDVIATAESYGLLDGQELIFDPSTQFYWDSDIQYYCDETILVICWKEQIENRVCSCVEVKIADGSQIRRKVMNDTFGSSEEGYASELAKSANAVVAMNADYYMYRSIGACVYQGQVGRFDTSCDLLLIDANGDFIMLRASELTDAAALQQFVTDNNVIFGMAFGPILVKDGELQQLSGSYGGGIGEMYEQYSRAGIGQVDKLHYLYMTVNHSKDATPRADVNTFAKIIYSKGVKNAYNFDGGQTSEIIFNGNMYNYVDWGNERTVSDIIYFATAIPNEEVGG